ncbi:MAG: cobyric acid synthase [Alphaproteobacteria bacterium]|nr:MAG: cobyric acid synthase [Alphaproteobacteria bacterium]
MVARSIMIQGTGSDVGKSILVAGLCRAFVNRGLDVRPFKPQNMSNNAAVTIENGEIGRAQWLQALACKVPPSVHMNPILLKPESDKGAQIIVHGQVAGHASAKDFNQEKPELFNKVMESFRHLQDTCDLIVVEGAGSPAEVNLRRGDIANMGFALPADVPVVLAGDIERGGVIAALVGTYQLLPENERHLIQGFIINKFRGDMSLFDDGLQIIEQHTGWPNMGVVPHLSCVSKLPAEDAVVLDRPKPDENPSVKIAVPMLSRIANFDDADPLQAHPDIAVQFCPPGTRLPDDADLIIIPGSKATIADLAFLRAQGWDADITRHVATGKPVLGLCGGYQMLGNRIHDPEGIEGPPGTTDGLGLLNVQTVLAGAKTVRTVAARSPGLQVEVPGYEIHCGQTSGPDTDRSFLFVDDQPVGAVSEDGLVFGSYVHGLFRSDAFRVNFLRSLGLQVSDDLDYAASVETALDDLANALEQHLDVDAILSLAR